MPRKSYRKKHSRKHQRGGGCGCGGTAVLGFPQSGGQMNSAIGSLRNTNSDYRMNTSKNTGMNSGMNSSSMNSGMNSSSMNTGMNSSSMNSGMNSSSMNNGMSFNSGKNKNNSFMSAFNLKSGGFLGMFNSPKKEEMQMQMQEQMQERDMSISPQSVVNQPRITNQSSDVNTRMSELENRLKKLEVGGSFFGGKRHLRHKSKKATRKHKKTRKH